jgi:hypothetical protein
VGLRKGGTGPASNAILGYLRSGKAVCPFARQAMLLVLDVDAEPILSRRDLVKIARKFAPTRGKTPSRALLLVGRDVEGYAATKRWAEECFLELAVALGVCEGETSVRMRADVDGKLRPRLLNEAARTRPVLSFGLNPVVCICMAPVYPADHPRFAPQPIVVVTWVSDVDRVPWMLRRAIRARATARNGGVEYDGDELMHPEVQASPASAPIGDP